MIIIINLLILTKNMIKFFQFINLKLNTVIILLILFNISKSHSKEIKKNNVNNILPKITVIANQSSDNDFGYNAPEIRSSTRTEKKLLDTPQSISVVTQQQIRDQNIVNMEEATRYIPSVNIQQGEGNRDQITIRGNATTADFFIDGARDDAQYFRDFYNIENVEFLRGPNALSFGRGGSGGVVNRVSKFANAQPKKELIVSGGSFNNRRIQSDFNTKINNNIFFRLNDMYEKTSTFREYGNMERFGINPTATIVLDNTDIKLGYEFFQDDRFNDRGIPSLNGSAPKISSKTFFGNPNENNSESRINSVYSIITHNLAKDLQIKNYTRYTNIHKFYKNVYANSAIDNLGMFNLASYSNSQERDNFTNQFDLIKKFNISSIKHTLLIGSELTNQDSNLIRKTGYFNNNSTSKKISLANPINFDPVTYRPSSTDPNNSSTVNIYAFYIQDEIEFNKYFQLTSGVRFDNFKINLTNNINNQSFSRNDNMISPRLGLVFKPIENLSIYSNYNVSYLPSAGDQFNNLNQYIKGLKPEKLQNYEIGSKLALTPKLNINTSLFQLDRSNSRAIDPYNPGFFVLTGASRTRGFEADITGDINRKLQIIAGYSYQEAQIIKNTESASKGKKAGLVPVNKISLWNKYNFNDNYAIALGFIKQSDQYASIDNSIRLQGFNRFDGALFYKINHQFKTQLNIENIFNKKYIATAHNNNNIQPGSPRAVKASIVMNF